MWEDEGDVYGWTYVYDCRNRLKEVYKGEGENPSEILAAYAYDYAGNRVAKMTADDYGVKTTTQFLVDNNNLTGYSQTLLDIDYPSGTITARYDYGDDLFAQINAPKSAAPSAHYFLYDGLGSTRSLTNAQGTIEQAYNYKPFGEANGFDPSSANQMTRNLFTGEQFDSETGFYHLRARQYDPRVGRFTSFDPAEDYANRLHRYNYCGHDPINCVDLSGLCGKGYSAFTGIQAHLLFKSFNKLAHPLYKPEALISWLGIRPDLYDPIGKRIWELKPITWRLKSGMARSAAREQMRRYQNKLKGSFGVSTEIVPAKMRFGSVMCPVCRSVYDVYFMPGHKKLAPGFIWYELVFSTNKTLAVRMLETAVYYKLAENILNRWRILKGSLAPAFASGAALSWVVSRNCTAAAVASILARTTHYTMAISSSLQARFAGMSARMTLSRGYI